jgi:DNA-binding transcriptional MocR family regulator
VLVGSSPRRPLDAARQPLSKGEAPDHERRAQDQDARLAQRLAEESQHAAAADSVRELATAAGVNVNTARAVYARLESEGIVASEHGRGTFVAPPPGEAAATRRELRRQIARLEAELARRPPPPTLAENSTRSGARGAALLSAEDLADVRDRLLDRLSELDAQRAALVGTLEQLGVEPVEVADSPPLRRGTPSLAGAGIRWIGG